MDGSLDFDRARLGGAVVGGGGAGGEAEPGAEDEKDLLGLGEAGGVGAEDLEALALELAEEAPIDGAHQLGGDHGATVGGGQGLPGGVIVLTGLGGDDLGEADKAVAVLGAEDFVGGDAAALHFGEG